MIVLLSAEVSSALCSCPTCRSKAEVEMSMSRSHVTLFCRSKLLLQSQCFPLMSVLRQMQQWPVVVISMGGSHVSAALQG